jgi:pimeloyl-ACP methyl ester carboxylesterase
VTPPLAEQAGNLRSNRPDTETVVFERAGHALFVDEPEQFNALLDDFARRAFAPR